MGRLDEDLVIAEEVVHGGAEVQRGGQLGVR
jgi:hypothetical protein